MSADDPHEGLSTHMALRPRADTTLVKVEDEAVVYQQDDGPLHGINPTGLLVWERLDGDRTLAAVIDELARRFDFPRQSVTDDVMTFATQLLDHGLLEVVARVERAADESAGG